MPIVFREDITIKPIDPPKAVALRLETLLDKYLPAAQPSEEASYSPTSEWRMRDRSDSRTSGASVTDVFADFEEHDLKPKSLFHDRRLPPLSDGSDGVDLEIFYSISRHLISLEVKGSNRTAVDGVAAACRRMKPYLEKHQDSGDQEGQVWRATPTANVQASAGRLSVAATPSERSWWKRTWKDHTAQFVVTVTGGLVLTGLVVWLNLG